MAKVVYANEEATIHVYFDQLNKKDDQVKSITLVPGEYIPFTDIPNYMKELVTQGDARGVSLRNIVLNKKEESKEEEVKEEIIEE